MLLLTDKRVPTSELVLPFTTKSVISRKTLPYLAMSAAAARVLRSLSLMSAQRIAACRGYCAVNSARVRNGNGCLGGSRRSLAGKKERLRGPRGYSGPDFVISHCRKAESFILVMYSYTRAGRLQAENRRSVSKVPRLCGNCIHLPASRGQNDQPRCEAENGIFRERASPK